MRYLDSIRKNTNLRLLLDWRRDSIELKCSDYSRSRAVRQQTVKYVDWIKNNDHTRKTQGKQFNFDH